MSGRFSSPLRTDLKGSRALAKRVKTEDGLGTTSVEDGREEYTYEINLDWEHIRTMARKAAENRSNQSHDGPVQVRITKRRRV